MKTLVRWSPVRELMALQNAMDNWYSDDRYTHRSNTDQYRWNIALDVVENDDEFVIQASIPGVHPDDLNITIEDDVLTVEGESKADETIKASDYRLRERRYGTFSRQIRFPVSINVDNIEARYENGILNLKVPKAEEVKPKKIAVRVAKK